MAENHEEEIERFMYENDKYMYCNHSGKQRTKKESSEHKNHGFDAAGHTRKIVNSLKNNEENRKCETNSSSKSAAKN